MQVAGKAKEQVGPTKRAMCKERKQIDWYCSCHKHIDVTSVWCHDIWCHWRSCGLMSHPCSQIKFFTKVGNLLKECIGLCVSNTISTGGVVAELLPNVWSSYQARKSLTISSFVSFYANPVKWVKWRISVDTYKNTCFSPSFCFPSFDVAEPLLLQFPVHAMVVSLAVGLISVLVSEVKFASIQWFMPNSGFSRVS